MGRPRRAVLEGRDPLTLHCPATRGSAAAWDGRAGGIGCVVRQVSQTHSAGHETWMAEAAAGQRLVRNMHAMRTCDGCTCLFPAAPFWFTESSDHDVAKRMMSRLRPSCRRAHPRRRTGAEPPQVDARCPAGDKLEICGDYWIGRTPVRARAGEVRPRRECPDGEVYDDGRRRNATPQNRRNVCDTKHVRWGDSRRRGGCGTGSQRRRRSGAHAEARRTRREVSPQFSAPSASPREASSPAVFPDSGITADSRQRGRGSDAAIRHLPDCISRTRKAPPDRVRRGFRVQPSLRPAVLRPLHDRRHPLSTR